MRVLLKILAEPIVVLLTLFVWICSGLLYFSAFVFGLTGTLISILDVAGGKIGRFQVYAVNHIITKKNGVIDMDIYYAIFSCLLILHMLYCSGIYLAYAI